MIQLRFNVFFAGMPDKNLKTEWTSELSETMGTEGVTMGGTGNCWEHWNNRGLENGIKIAQMRHIIKKANKYAGKTIKCL